MNYDTAIKYIDQLVKMSGVTDTKKTLDYALENIKIKLKLAKEREKSIETLVLNSSGMTDPSDSITRNLIKYNLEKVNRELLIKSKNLEVSANKLRVQLQQLEKDKVVNDMAISRSKKIIDTCATNTNDNPELVEKNKKTAQSIYDIFVNEKDNINFEIINLNKQISDIEEKYDKAIALIARNEEYVSLNEEEVRNENVSVNSKDTVQLEEVRNEIVELEKEKALILDNPVMLADEIRNSLYLGHDVMSIVNKARKILDNVLSKKYMDINLDSNTYKELQGLLVESERKKDLLFHEINGKTYAIDCSKIYEERIDSLNKIIKTCDDGLKMFTDFSNDFANVISGNANDCLDGLDNEINTKKDIINTYSKIDKNLVGEAENVATTNRYQENINLCQKLVTSYQADICATLDFDSTIKSNILNYLMDLKKNSLKEIEELETLMKSLSNLGIDIVAKLVDQERLIAISEDYDNLKHRIELGVDNSANKIFDAFTDALGLGVNKEIKQVEISSLSSDKVKLSDITSINVDEEKEEEIIPEVQVSEDIPEIVAPDIDFSDFVEPIFDEVEEVEEEIVPEVQVSEDIPEIVTSDIDFSDFAEPQFNEVEEVKEVEIPIVDINVPTGEIEEPTVEVEEIKEEDVNISDIRGSKVVEAVSFNEEKNEDLLSELDEYATNELYNTNSFRLDDEEESEIDLDTVIKEMDNNKSKVDAITQYELDQEANATISINDLFPTKPVETEEIEEVSYNDVAGDLYSNPFSAGDTEERSSEDEAKLLLDEAMNEIFKEEKGLTLERVA